MLAFEDDWKTGAHLKMGHQGLTYAWCHPTSNAPAFECCSESVSAPFVSTFTGRNCYLMCAPFCCGRLGEDNCGAAVTRALVRSCRVALWYVCPCEEASLHAQNLSPQSSSLSLSLPLGLSLCLSLPALYLDWASNVC